MLTAPQFGFTELLFARLNRLHSDEAERHRRENFRPRRAWTSVRFGQTGASESDLQTFERANGLYLPKDLRTLAQIVHDPDGAMFPWLADPQCLATSNAWIQRGIEFDIRNGSAWLERWGEPPSEAEDRIAVFRADVASWPTLVPVANRFHRITPNKPGNPVYSIMQTDIVYYGADLASWLASEFFREDPIPEAKEAMLPADSPWDAFAMEQGVRRDLHGRSDVL